MTRDSAHRVVDLPLLEQLQAGAAPLEAGGHAVCAVNRLGQVAYWNDRAEDVTGWPAADVLGRALTSLFTDEGPDLPGDGPLQCLAQGQPCSGTVRMRRPDGTEIRLDVAGEPVLARGQTLGAAAVLRSLSAEDDRARMRELAAVLAQAPDPVFVVDADRRVTEWNPAAERVLGHSRAEMLGSDPLRLLQQADRDVFGRVWTDLRAGRQSADFQVAPADAPGRRHALSVHLGPIVDGGTFTGAVVTMRDRSPDGAGQDSLTGLLRREDVLASLRWHAQAGVEMALAMVDLDAFALINDTYGLTVGDGVLREIGGRLTTAAPEAAVGRWSSDEFVLLFTGAGSRHAAERAVHAAIEVCRAPVVVGRSSVRVSASGGVAGTADAPAERLPVAAAAAVRSAQRNGRDRWEPYQAAPTPPTDEARLSRELGQALERQELVLHYQPIVESRTLRPVGVEALVRWDHPDRGRLAAGEFMPVAEKTGLVLPLGAWVLEEACSAAVRWSRQPALAGLTVAVNVSAQQLLLPGLVDLVSRTLARTGCPVQRLHLEVTETAVLEDLDAAVEILQQLRDLGVELSIDDFGTGYSSMVYLKRFPVTTVKIDSSFVAGLGVHVDDSAIVASVVSLARSVEVRAVAEGVETRAQQQLLEAMHCDRMQGYLHSRPLSEADLLEWMPAQLSAAAAPARDRARGSKERRPDDPAAVARILQLHHAGASPHTIAARLNAEGSMTGRGVRWHRTSVARIIAARSS